MEATFLAVEKGLAITMTFQRDNARDTLVNRGDI